ncbi:MAG: ABC transporter permease [Terracidiphilus sp.]
MRLLELLRRERAESEIDAELESHIAMHTSDGVRAGLSETEARRRALIRLGGAEQTRQAYRERRGLPWLESLSRDLRLSVRTLAKHPAVTAIAILSIGLGIGANAAIFSMVSRFVLRPAPVREPATLLSLHTWQKGDNCCNNFSWPLYQDLRADSKSFSDLAAFYELLPASIGGNGEPERVWGQAVTTNFFSVTGLKMVAGRGFSSNEDSLPMVVLGEDLWRRRFNGDASIVGRTVLLSGRTFTVVGIAPAAFRSIDQILYCQFWVPLGMVNELVPNVPPKGSREFHWLGVVARMRPGVARAQVVAELNALAARFAKSYPATDKDNSFVFEQAGSLPPREREGVLIFLLALSIVVLLVLAIACANVANLLFAQAAARQRDIAVCLAVGATPGRVLRQMLMESVLLGLAGGLMGVTLSLWATQSLSAMRLPAPIPLSVGIGVDWRVLLFAFALSVASGALLGAGPAWAASRPRLANALKGEDALARFGKRWTLRNFLVVAQIAMSVVLLSVTVLFLRSLESAANIEIGFRPRGLLMLSIDPRVHGYTAERTSEFLTELRARVAALPGVISTVCTDVAPLSGGNRSDGFTVAGHSERDKAIAFADLYMVTPGYFDALGIPLLSGHDIGGVAADAPKIAIVNKAFVDRLFGGVNPIGQHVNGGHWTYEIIGVAGNMKSRTLGEDVRPILFRSLDQSIADDPSLMGYTLVVHTAGNPAALSEAVRRQVYRLDPSMAIYNEETMEEHVRTAYFLPRLAARLFGVFGGIGLLLAAIGLYGVMSYAVSRRTREIGIRMAMGAKRGTVQRMVLRQGALLTLIAIALGWPAAWILSKLAASFLYGVQPHDAFTFAIVPPLLAVIALAACWIPARRAASVDPMQALRTE